MAQKNTEHISDYVNDYEQAWQDYSEMGPLWAEMVFGDDFEALKAIYGGRDQHDNQGKQSGKNQDNRGGNKRR